MRPLPATIVTCLMSIILTIWRTSMYTSGSTGTPKGVAVPHRAIARLLFGVDYASFGSDRVIGQLAPLAFDASTFEIWGALLHGGRCALYRVVRRRRRNLVHSSNRHCVDTLFLTTGLFNTIIDADPRALTGLRQLLTGGEAISVSHVRKALTLCRTSTWCTSTVRPRRQRLPPVGQFPAISSRPQRLCLSADRLATHHALSSTGGMNQFQSESSANS